MEQVATGKSSARSDGDRPSKACPIPSVTSAARQSPADRSLDQWRGLALLLVLVSHAFHQTGRVPGIGRAGVNLFFFISGILVYRSLDRGPKSPIAGAKSFWWRRIKRLVPAKYFYLICISALVLLVPWYPITPDFRRSFLEGLPSSLLYYRNYYIGSGADHENLAGHLWSLACEMQFYIIAPLIFFAGGRNPQRRILVWGTILALFLAGGVSVVFKSTYEPYTFGVAAWPMMVGFCAEFLRSSGWLTGARFGKFFIACGLASIVAVGLTLLTANKKLVILAGTPMVAGCLGCYLLGVAPINWVGTACHFLGNRTYSIYLWQQPLTIGGLVPQVLHPLGSLFSVAVGSLSFRFLEQPFMSKYKPKKAPVASEKPGVCTPVSPASEPGA